MNLEISNNIKYSPNYKCGVNRVNNASKVYFGNCYQNDFFDCSNIKTISYNKHNNIESIEFTKPLNISQAILTLADSDNDYIVDEMYRKFHTQENLLDLALSSKCSKDISNLKVKSFIGMGAYALTFETVDGDVIKVTENDHFPNGRKPASFDLPIKSSGKFRGFNGTYYYYIEEKVTQNDLTQDELLHLVKKIKNLGYRMKDYLMHYCDDEETMNVTIKSEQFGRAKNGKVYLIDPGCAIETDNVYKSGGYNSFKRFLKCLLK